MQAQAKILADSVRLPLDSEGRPRSYYTHGDRLTTMEVRLARSALAEFNTHRAFSRNSASSRAIPVKKMIEMVEKEPYEPREFSLAGKGMAPSKYISNDLEGHAKFEDCLSWWHESKDAALKQAKRGLDLGLHKQDVNRLLEPFMMHTIIVSATEWENFFKLRLAKDPDTNRPLAYLPIYDAAVAMQEALNKSEPELKSRHHVLLDAWHLPLIGFEGDEQLDLGSKIRVSAARCARVSYLTHEGVRDVDADLRLFSRLVENGHLSPLEHVAVAQEQVIKSVKSSTPSVPNRTAEPLVRSSNFSGWNQLRHVAWSMNHSHMYGDWSNNV